MPSASARSPPSTAGTSPLWSSSAPDVAVTSAPGSISTAYRTATSCAARWCTGSQPGAQRCYFFAPAWGYGLTDRSCASQALSICREAHYRLSLRDTPSAWHGVALRPRTTLLVGQPPPNHILRRRLARTLANPDPWWRGRLAQIQVQAKRMPKYAEAIDTARLALAHREQQPG